MFTLAGASFTFGIWQYVSAHIARSSASERMAYIMTTIEDSGLPRAEKRTLYASIMSGLPPAPTFLGIDISGSFAGQVIDDRCTSDGQRAVCRSLVQQHTDTKTMTAICGICNPQ